MYVELYEYLLINNELPVPNLGTFFLERRPASIDFPNKMINAPFYSIRYDESVEDDQNRLVNWLAVSLRTTIESAKQSLDEFAKQFSNDLVIDWKGMGTIRKKGPRTVFIPEAMVAGLPVTANKVLREKAHHTVRVGEDERTSLQMEEMLSVQTATKKSTWWVLALIVGLSSVIFIGWYLSEHGVNTSSTANTTKASIDETRVP